MIQEVAPQPRHPQAVYVIQQHPAGQQSFPSGFVENQGVSSPSTASLQDGRKQHHEVGDDGRMSSFSLQSQQGQLSQQKTVNLPNGMMMTNTTPNDQGAEEEEHGSLSSGGTRPTGMPPGLAMVGAHYLDYGPRVVYGEVAAGPMSIPPPFADVGTSAGGRMVVVDSRGQTILLANNEQLIGDPNVKNTPPGTAASYIVPPRMFHDLRLRLFVPNRSCCLQPLEVFLRRVEE